MRRGLLLGALAALIVVPATLAAGSPSVSTGNATSVTGSGATVHGTVKPEGQSTRYAFQYGTDNKYGHETALTAAGKGTLPISVSANITGLVSGTTYHYRILALAADNSPAVGDTATFKTTGSPPIPPKPKPTVTTGGSSAIGTNGATVSGIVNPMGLATMYYFEFGTTAGYGYQTTPASAGNGV